MTDDKTQPDANDRTGQAEPVEVGQPARQRQAAAAAQPDRRAAPGRTPLFRR